MAQLPTPEELAAAQNALDEAARAESEAISALAVLGDPIYKNKVYRRTNLSEIRELQKIAKGLTSARKTAESTLKKVRQPIEDAKKQVSELRKKISPEDIRTGQRKQVVGPSAAAAQIADLERQISAAEGQPAPKPKDETKPAQAWKGLETFEYSTLAIQRAPLASLGLFGQRELGIRVIVYARTASADKVDALASAGSDPWRRIALQQQDMSWRYLPDRVTVRPQDVAWLDFEGGFGAEDLLIFVPENPSNVSLTGKDRQSLQVKPEFSF